LTIFNFGVKTQEELCGGGREGREEVRRQEAGERLVEV